MKHKQTAVRRLQREVSNLIERSFTEQEAQALVLVMDETMRILSRLIRGRRSGIPTVLKIGKAIKYIQQHARKQLSLEEVANHIHMAPLRFCKRIHRLTGKKFSAHVREARMQHARKLLRNPRNTVVMVSKCSGYPTISHFNRMFKMAYGISPTQYREQEKIAA